MRKIEFRADDLVAGATRHLLQGNGGSAKASEDSETQLPTLDDEHTVGRLDVFLDAAPVGSETATFFVELDGTPTGTTLVITGAAVKGSTGIKSALVVGGNQEVGVTGALSASAALPGFTRAIVTLYD